MEMTLNNGNVNYSNHYASGYVFEKVEKQNIISKLIKKVSGK